MDSALDSISAAGDGMGAPGTLRGRWRARWRAVLAGLGLHAFGNHSGRVRRVQVDGWRATFFTAGVVVAAVLLSLGFSWRQHSNTAQAAAQQAMSFVDTRAQAIEREMQRLANHPSVLAADAAATFESRCSPDLVAALLDNSLASLLVRRFDLHQPGVAQKCGPQGLQTTEPFSAPLRPGLSLVAGQQIAGKPLFMLAAPGGVAVLATLDDNALALPQLPWAEHAAAPAVRVVVTGDGARGLLLTPARQARGTPLPALRAQAASSHYPLGVVADVDKAEFMRAAARQALAAAASAFGLALLFVAFTWRRTMLRARLLHRIERALRKRQFVPFVQPIVDLRTGRCVGGEVLMRWNHPQRGILGPGEFIEEAERTGLILGMSELTMQLAAHRLAALAQADPSLYFSFNVTPGQLRLPDFAQTLGEIFRADTIPRQQVLLELTERDFMDPLATGKLVALRADGWRIAIDDFGTGQSSLATIEKLPIDRIKIDRAFVSTVDERTVNRPVLDAIIGLARELNVALIAEGIETRSQWDYLAARGVACAQGYLMAKPMPIPDFVQWAIKHDGSTQAAVVAPSHNPASPARANTAPALTVQETQLRQLWQQLGQAGDALVQDRRHGVRLYPQCLVGREMVSWMARERGISRAEALRLGRSLLAAGLLRHVVDEHDFKDDNLFYVLTPADAVAKASTQGPSLADLKSSLHRALDLPWRDHCHGLLRHRRCASGRTVVSWIVQHHPAPRSQATEWAAQLMRQGALRHIFDDQPFRDDDTLYRLN